MKKHYFYLVDLYKDGKIDHRANGTITIPFWRFLNVKDLEACQKKIDSEFPGHEAFIVHIQRL